MGKSEYTLEEVKHIIDLTWGFAYEDWQLPGYDLYDYILYLQEIGKTNGDLKKEGDANLGYHKFCNPDPKALDTLQEGDWFEGSEEQYRKALEIQGDYDEAKDYMGYIVLHGIVFSESRFKTTFSQDDLRITQLTPEEFIRRAENTFKTK